MTLATRQKLRSPFPFDDWRMLEGLVFYAPLWNEKTRLTPFASLDPYHHTCTVTGAVWGSTGRTYTGGDDLIDCGRNTIFDMGADTDFSILAWINLTDVTDYRMIVSKGAEKRYHLDVEITTGKLRFDLDDDVVLEFLDGDTDVSDGVWHLVGVTVDRDGDGTLWLDRVADCTPKAIATATVDDTTKDLCVGVSSSNETSYNFEGLIGEVWLYRGRILSASVMSHIYNKTKGTYL